MTTFEPGENGPRSSRRTAALATVALLALSTAPPVRAHEEAPLHALSVIDRVQPEFPGVSFRVAQLMQPVLVATNRSDRPLVILGTGGEPFLRLWDGRIETNVESNLTYVSRDPTGRLRAPADFEARGRPRWQLIEHGVTWSWFDPRIQFAPGRDSWEVEARLGGRPIVVRGSFEVLVGHGHFKTELVAVPEIQGLDIHLLQGAVPSIFVRNGTTETLVVRGLGGEPFLRIGPGGVMGNKASPDLYLGGQQTIRAVPAFARPGAAPRWRRLSPISTWSWLEMRAGLPERLHQRDVLGPRTRTVLRWKTPVTLGGESLDLRGRVVWIPARSAVAVGEESVRTEPLPIAIAVLVAGLGALALFRLLTGPRRSKAADPL